MFSGTITNIEKSVGLKFFTVDGVILYIFQS